MLAMNNILSSFIPFLVLFFISFNSLFTQQEDDTLDLCMNVMGGMRAKWRKKRMRRLRRKRRKARKMQYYYCKSGLASHSCCPFSDASACPVISNPSTTTLYVGRIQQAGCFLLNGSHPMWAHYFKNVKLCVSWSMALIYISRLLCTLFTAHLLFC